MATCSEVASCLSEGATVCILTSGTCPPCVYALSGGDFSCYSRDTSGACPFSGAYAECDKASSSTSSTSSKTSSGDSSGGSNSNTPAPTTKTKAPAKTTAAPTATTAPTTSTSEASSSAGGNANSNATPSTDATTTPSTDATTTPSTDATSSPSTDATSSPSTDATSSPSATTASSNTDQTTQTASSSSADSSAEKALTSNTASTSGSPAVVNLALIGGAVVLVVIVIAFVARRVVKKKKMYHTQDRTVSSHNSAWSDRTLGTGASGGNLYSTYSYKDEAGKGNGISMLSDSQASSTYGPGYDQSHSGSSPRSKADFSNYGGDSQYATESQYYNDYSVSTGPELMAAGAAAGNQHPYANNTVPPSARGNNNFVDATSMANRESSIGSVRQHPLTVSQLMPTSIEEDEEQAYASRRPAPEQYHAAIPPVPQTTRTPQIFAASTASSMRSDYDIVDPITMQDVEARNTEMLAEDSRYPKFSFESEAASDVDDGSSSEEESDDERVRHGEHTI